ncbi:MAG: 16S rRNA (cytosine(967)-C(5))-methyltransferase RsmB [Burkholderiaceae bacterium]
MNESLPLWRQIQAVSALLLQVQRGVSATAAMLTVEPALRPAAQSLFFQVLRSLARAQHLRGQLAARRPTPAGDALLCVALALAWRGTDTPYTPFTLVNQTVEAAKRDPAVRAQAGFINGCLRRFLREREVLVARSETDAVARWNHPAWWIRRVQADHPEHWPAVLQADLQQAPMTLRVNRRRSTPAAYLVLLESQGIAARANGEFGVQLQRAAPVHQLPGFDDGVVSVQDSAAQMAAPLLLDGLEAGARPRILDACAAPGGKTGHLLELVDGDVLALDVDPERCERIRSTLARLGLTANIVAADAARPDIWWDGAPFDRILLDAPCTASGIVRRHPDVPWLRRESDISEHAGGQALLLQALWPLLRAGGRMVYCTCSVFRAEGDDQIETFLAHNTDALLLPSPGQLLPQLGPNQEAVPDNQKPDHDGFFYTLLEKIAA